VFDREGLLSLHMKAYHSVSIFLGLLTDMDIGNDAIHDYSQAQTSSQVLVTFKVSKFLTI
jgi:hypothetical protein